MIQVYSHKVILSDMAQARVRDFFRQEFPLHTTRVFIWVDSNESGSEMSLWLRPEYTTTGGRRLTMPEGLVLIPRFYEESLTPGHSSLHNLVYHYVCASAEAVHEIRESVVLRRKLSDEILGRANELEQLANSLK